VAKNRSVRTGAIGSQRNEVLEKLLLQLNSLRHEVATPLSSQQITRPTERWPSSGGDERLTIARRPDFAALVHGLVIRRFESAIRQFYRISATHNLPDPWATSADSQSCLPTEYSGRYHNTKPKGMEASIRIRTASHPVSIMKMPRIARITATGNSHHTIGQPMITFAENVSTTAMTAPIE